MSDPGDLHRIRSNLRLVCILQACHDAGMPSVPLSVVHTVAYFANALAPIWDIPLIEGQLLKKKRVPASPQLQEEIDGLVGRAVILASHIRHNYFDGIWSLDADYSLNPTFGERIVLAMSRDTEYVRELAFVHEVVLALAGLGVPGMSVAAEADATYSDPTVDIGGIVDLDLGEEELTKTAQVANRFAELLDENRHIGEAEITHLYVRHLYSVLGRRGA